MKVKTLVLGPLKTNCYLIEKENNCLIIDPASDFELIKREIGSLNIVGILITHYHFDHIGALKELVSFYNVPIYDYKSNSTSVNDFNFEVIHNPGHTSDSVSFYFKQDKIMFVGDFIFKGTIGRTDLDTGNDLDMMDSLEKLKKYPDDIHIYPGHGSSTYLEYEKENNMYLKRQN